MKWLICAIVFITTVPSFSQVDSSDTLKNNSKHSIQLNPIGLILGSCAGNYEVLLGRRHGIVIEGTYVFPSLSKNKGYGAALLYRFHLKPEMNSKFLGAFLRKDRVASSIVVGERIKETYDYSVSSLCFGADYGWRKQLFKTKLNYAFRIGLGIPVTTFQWKNGRPESLGGMQTATFEKIMKYSLALDSELTVGFSF